MSGAPRLQGVLSPVVTPFGADGAPSPARLLDHCRWLLSQDVGLAVFGTNSEGNSLSLVEKRQLLDHLAAGGIPGQRLMPGTGTCAIPETVELTRHAVQLGCAGVLVLPPFYYKGTGDEGLFAYFARVIEEVADARLRVYLYHIPPVAQVGIGPALIERLLKAYPGVVAGIKDSSGDVSNTALLLREFQPAGFDVFAGNETLLLSTLRGGGAGCITATGNVNPAAIAQLYRSWQAPDADAQQAQLDAVRAAFQAFPIIAAMKWALARATGDASWAQVRPPLVALAPDQAQALAQRLDALGFAMPRTGALAAA